MATFFLINTLITSTEFAGIRAATEIFHVSGYISVPVALVAVFLFVLRFNNKTVERTFVVLSLVYLTYIASAILAHPDWKAVAVATVVPAFDLRTAGWLAMLVGIIGTTISPYMQFFLQSAVVDKGSRAEDLTMARADVINGSVLAIALAGFMIVASAATIFVANEHGAHLAPDQSPPISPSPSSRWRVRWRRSCSRSASSTPGSLPQPSFRSPPPTWSAKRFGFEACRRPQVLRRRRSSSRSLAPAWLSEPAIVLIPGLPLLSLILISQVMQGILLPAELVLMLIVVNRKSVMGDYTNTVSPTSSAGRPSASSALSRSSTSRGSSSRNFWAARSRDGFCLARGRRAANDQRLRPRLGAIEGFVGQLHERFDVCESSGRSRCRCWRERRIPSVGLTGFCIASVGSCVRDRRRRLAVDDRLQDDELVAAEPRQRVALAQGRAKPRRRGAQEFVAYVVAEVSFTFLNMSMSMYITAKPWL